MKYRGICAGPDGLLYCAPWNAPTVLVIDPWTRTLGFIKGAGETGEKYFGICAGPDGRLHCGPCNASSVIVIHPGTRTLSFIGNIRDGGQKYCGICKDDIFYYSYISILNMNIIIICLIIYNFKNIIVL